MYSKRSLFAAAFGALAAFCASPALSSDAVLLRAFVFGASGADCVSPNDPALPYVVVEPSSPEALEYSPARGWGYEVVAPGAGGYGRFGPLGGSSNLQGVFPAVCPARIYNSSIGVKPLQPCTFGAPPCLPPEGVVFRVDVPNGKYRFVAAVGNASFPHAHRIAVEDGGSGPAGNFGVRYAVLVENFDQAVYPPPSFARVGFDGRLPPRVEGAVFVDMDGRGLPTAGAASSPELEVTSGHIRVHQLKGATSGGDGDGADMALLEIWRVGDALGGILEGSSWKYLRGIGEASWPDPSSWRGLEFDDSAWPEGSAPFGFGMEGIATDLGALSPPMQGNYTSLFLRRLFWVSAPEAVGQLVVRARYDDGFVLWVNGVEALRVNAPGVFGDPVPYDAVASSEHEYVLPEDYDLPDASEYLVAGANAIAVQVLNFSLSDPDVYFDLALFDAAAPDAVPPAAVEIVPSPGATVRSLAEVRVRFSELVSGVDAKDLLVGGSPAQEVIGLGAGPYIFRFPQVPRGAVDVRWDLRHGIADLAPVPNSFRGGAWTYTVDPDAARGPLRIHEILALNGTGLRDEDGDESDWIEIINAGDWAVDLEGFSLTDDPEDPRLWVFPKLLLGAKQYLIVFASGKDRRDPRAPLHANFELSGSGEYLGLFSPDSPPKAVSEIAPRYPSQRADISYGIDSSGRYAYLDTPTPGGPNSAALSYEGFALDPSFSPPRGFYEQPVEVRIWSRTPGATVRYTLDGSAPTPARGIVYSGPIIVAPTGGRGGVPVRAIAYKSGLLPSRVSTHTYLFPEALMRQSGSPEGFPRTWGAQPADYAMDPRVVDDPGHSELVRLGLRSLATLCISTRVEDLFGPTGIYANPSQTGRAWERPASVELIHPDGRTGFHVDCGLRIQGGTSTSGWKSIKLSMRLFFRADYGVPKLTYRLFPDAATESFDTVVLDAHLNLTWNHPDHGQRVLAQYVRDCFTSDLQNAVGGYAPHDTYAHVYLDGLYWGLYDVHERPDHAFAATYFGGDKSEYDAVRHNLTSSSNVVNGDISGWNAAFAFARGGLADYQRYLAFGDLVDIPNFVDYMIVNFWVGNTDWAHQNWYSTRRRSGGLIRYHSWDAEHVLKSVGENRLGANNTGGPTELFQRLRENPEFRILFADRAHKHFSPGGPLYVNPANSSWDPSRPWTNRPADLYMRRIDEVDGYVRRDIFGDRSVGSGIACESARWGDAKSPADEYTRNNEWLAELGRLLRDYFPRRSGIVLEQFRAAGLYPSVPAPLFSHPGGTVEPGFRLQLFLPQGAVGTIYYTTDGTDPRVAGTGQVSVRARAYSSPIEIGDFTTVKARTLWGSEWSALGEVTFALASPRGPLRVTEILYNAPEGPGCEFVELQNTGDSTIGLSGAYFAEGIEFVFPAGTKLGPGEFLVLAGDQRAFAEKYPGSRAYGAFTGNLSNSGERLRLVGRDGAEILSLRYDDEGLWPIAPDGFGYSLVLADPDGDPSSPQSWRASSFPGGSPGAPDPPPRQGVGGVFVSEVLANAPPPLEGAVELVNCTGQWVDLGGWYLSDARDSAGSLAKFQIPRGTYLEPGGYIVFYQGEFSAGPSGFRLNPRGGAVYLSSAGAGGELTGHIAEGRYGAQAPGVSFGRISIGTGFDFAALARRSFGVDDPQYVEEFRTGRGAPNGPPLVGPVVINEIHYNPQPGSDEFVELHNLADFPIRLFDLSTARAWRLEGVRGAENADAFEFSPWDEIPARGYLLVVGIPPDLFRVLYAVPSSVPIVGPFWGELGDGGGALRLLKPAQRALGSSAFVLIDRVRYDDDAPWPERADGRGPSLERIYPDFYGDDAFNWAESEWAGGTPGWPNSVSGSAGNRPPRAVFFATPPSGKAPLVVFFDASPSADFDGRIVEYRWDFGDGSSDSGVTTVHAFTEAGVYSVTLSVADDRGAVASASRTVSVEPPVRGRQIPSDANQDGRLDISDSLKLLLYLFAVPGPLPCGGLDIRAGGNLLLLDADGDGSVGITDAVRILSHIFRDGPGPALGVECLEIPGCPDSCR